MSSNEVPSDGTDPIEVQIWKIMMKNKAIDNSADYAGFTSMVKEIAQGDAPQGKEGVSLIPYMETFTVKNVEHTYFPN
eukprot:m.20990 g.20990  ORF g.20990 m.20990 type:complete len:78 (+) comp7005_c0_seq2:110-343(+)